MTAEAKIFLIILFIILTIIIIIPIINKTIIIPHKQKEIEAEKELQKQKYEYVKNHSTHYKELCEINKKYKFHIFNDLIKYTFSCNNLNNFRNFNFENELINILINNEKNIYLYINKAIENRLLYEEYKMRIANIVNSIRFVPNNCEIDKQEFYKIQKEIVNNSIINPTTNINIIVYSYYSSPAGRNNYEDSNIYNLDELIKLHKKAEQIKSQKATYQNNAYYERSKMTPTLRYSILSRDGFRCVKCGATVNDGAKLHVDHIIPVSKGGKTIESNLQTLCDRCNFGKSNKL